MLILNMSSAAEKQNFSLLISKVLSDNADTKQSSSQPVSLMAKQQ